MHAIILIAAIAGIATGWQLVRPGSLAQFVGRLLILAGIAICALYLPGLLVS